MTNKEIYRMRHLYFLTQADLARLVGIHSGTISRFERGIVKPSPWLEGLFEAFLEVAFRVPDACYNVQPLLNEKGPIAALTFILKARKDDT